MAAEPADANYRVVEVEIRAVPDQLAPDAVMTCPCPLAGRRCGDCCLISITGPPPFRVTPLGWALASLRLIWFRIQEPFLKHADD